MARVLMLTDLYPPIIGGTEQYVQRLSGELAQRGHKVAVATLSHPGLADREMQGGVSIHRLRGLAANFDGLFSNPGRRFAPPVPDPGVMLGLRGLVGDFRPDIVHAHNWLVHSFLPLKSSSNAGLVVSLHDYSLVCANKSLLRDHKTCIGPSAGRCIPCSVSFYGAARGLPTLLGTWAMRMPEEASVDMFLPVSQAVARGARLEHGRAPFRVIPNFVQDENPAATPDLEVYARQLPSEPFLLFVGMLGSYKGLHVLLEAYAQLVDAPPLVLIGPRAADTPNSLPPGVTLLSDWPHAAVLSAWRRSLLGLVPSVWAEPCPTVALEAMSAGRAVIASSVGGLPDLVVDGETGFLVPPADAPALRQAIERLLGERDLLERMGHAGKLRARQFQASTVVGRIEAVYAEVEASACQR